LRGNIEHRGGNTWRLRVFLGRDKNGKQRQKRRTVHGTKSEAEFALAQLLVEVGQGDHALDDETTLGQAVDLWLASQPDLRASTAEDYSRVIAGHIKPAVGDIFLQRLTKDDLNGLYGQGGSMQKAGVGPDRRRRAYGVIRRTLADAVAAGHLPANVADHSKPPSAGKPDLPPPPSPDTVALIMKTARAEFPGMDVFVRVAAVTGARRGELIALKWSDIDLDAGTLTIARAISAGAPPGNVPDRPRLHEGPTKTRQTRTMSIDPGTLAVLATHRGEALDQVDSVGGDVEARRVFTDDQHGLIPWAPDNLTRRFKRVCRAAGVEGVRLHDLRHALATQLIAAGVDVVTVSARLGHAKSSTTLDMYASPVDEAGIAAGARIASIYGD